MNPKPKSQSVQVWLVLAFLLTALASPFFLVRVAAADDASAGQAQATLIKQGWYESDVAKKNLASSDPNAAKTLQDTVNELKSKKHLGVLAILDNTTIPTRFNGDPDAYAEYLRTYITPNPDIVVIVNGDAKKVGLAANKLTGAQETTIQNNARSTFTTGAYGNAVRQIALDAESKISSEESSSMLTTIAIVVVVLVLLIVGIVFLFTSTKNNWKRQLQSLQELNSKVSDLIVRIGDGLDYLPDSNRDSAKSSFSQATANMSNAQSSLHELQSASPIQLVLQGGKYRQQLNNTGSQLQTSYNLLAQLERAVEKI
jgi:hypothetical protein